MSDAHHAILIVEDEPHDIEFLQRAFRRAGIPSPTHAVENGEQAVAYLSGSGAFADRAAYPLPRLIITDLKMPHMGGLELLRWLRAHPTYRAIPAVVLSSSTSDADVDAAYQAGANGYMVKPVEFENLERIARVIGEYWRLSLVPRLAS